MLADLAGGEAGLADHHDGLERVRAAAKEAQLVFSEWHALNYPRVAFAAHGARRRVGRNGLRSRTGTGSGPVAS
jgi:hypothetical protein